MRLSPLVTTSLLVLGLGSVSEAGWGHRHHHHHGVATSPATFLMPVAVAGAPAESSNALGPLGGVLLEKLIDRLLPAIPQVPGTRPSVPPSVDFSRIEENLASLSERVENANTTLRTHGETLVAISARLKSVEDDVKKLRTDVVEGSPLMATLNEIKTKVSAKSPSQIKDAVLSNEFISSLADVINDQAKTQTAIDAISNQLDKALRP